MFINRYRVGQSRGIHTEVYTSILLINESTLCTRQGIDTCNEKLRAASARRPLTPAMKADRSVEHKNWTSLYPCRSCYAISVRVSRVGNTTFKPKDVSSNPASEPMEINVSENQTQLDHFNTSNRKIIARLDCLKPEKG